MTPAPTLIALTWIGSIVAGYVLGKFKGHVSAGIILTVILGPLGLVIFACLARTYAVKAASAQRLYESQPEAVRRAGYAYPPQSPHPAPDQDPCPPQSPPGGGIMAALAAPSRPATVAGAGAITDTPGCATA